VAHHVHLERGVDNLIANLPAFVRAAQDSDLVTVAYKAPEREDGAEVAAWCAAWGTTE
jgi:hypothetical protein